MKDEWEPNDKQFNVIFMMVMVLSFLLGLLVLFAGGLGVIWLWGEVMG